MNAYRITRTLKSLKYPVAEVMRSTFSGTEEQVFDHCKAAEKACPDYIYHYEFLWEV